MKWKLGLYKGYLGSILLGCKIQGLGSRGYDVGFRDAGLRVSRFRV